MSVTLIQSMGDDKGKECRGCLKFKRLEEYPIRKDRGGKLRPYCSECANDIVRKRYDSHKRNSPFKLRATRARARSLYINKHCDLTPEYLESIWTGLCPVLNIPLKWSTDRYDESAAELDRFIPDLGYIKGNVHFLSRKANRLKNNSSVEDIENLLRWMKANAVS